MNLRPGVLLHPAHEDSLATPPAGYVHYRSSASATYITFRDFAGSWITGVDHRDAKGLRRTLQIPPIPSRCLSNCEA